MTKQLQLINGKTVDSYTGLSLHNTQTNTTETIVEPYKVHLKTYDDTTLASYLKKEKPYQCAGSLRVEGLGICLIARLEGNDPNALTGLPLIQLVSLLTKHLSII